MADQYGGYGNGGGAFGGERQAKASGKIAATIFGNIASDVTYKPAEGNVSSRIEFSVAQNYVEKGAQLTAYIRCTVWGSQNGANDNYLRLYTDGFRKGLPIAVAGSVTKIGAYIDKQGVAQPSIDFKVSELLARGTYLDQGQQQQAPQQQQQQYQAPQQQYQGYPQQQAPPAQGPYGQPAQQGGYPAPPPAPPQYQQTPAPQAPQAPAPPQTAW